jgi:hypothetical protein
MIFPSGEMTTIPSETDSTSNESNGSGVFKVSSLPVIGSDCMQYTNGTKRAFQDLNGRNMVKRRG